MGLILKEPGECVRLDVINEIPGQATDSDGHSEVSC
jgi:hypothetical protein